MNKTILNLLATHKDLLFRKALSARQARGTTPCFFCHIYGPGTDRNGYGPGGPGGRVYTNVCNACARAAKMPMPRMTIIRVTA